MDKLLNNITKIVVYLIMALGIAFTVWTISKGDDLDGNVELSDKVLNPYFLLTLVTMIIAAAGAILFPLGQMFLNPKAALKTGISLVILAVIYGISWSLASDSIAGEYFAKYNVTESMSKFIGSLIYVVYILGAFSFLAIIVSGILGAFSKR